MRGAGHDNEPTLVLSTIRRILGRQSRTSRGRSSSTFGLLRLLTLVPFVLLIGLLAVWWLGAIKLALAGSGPVFQLDHASFSLPPGKGLTIGRALLMQHPGFDSAEAEHIRFDHNMKGEVRISNVAKQRRLGLLRDQQTSNAIASDRAELTGPADETTRIFIEDREVIFRKVTGAGFEVEIVGSGRFQADIGLGWNRLRPIDANGRPGEDLPSCAYGWRDFVQAHVAWLAVLFDRGLDQPVVRFGGDRSCQVGLAFQLALPRPDDIDEFAVSMVPEDRWGSTRRLFVYAVDRHPRNLVTIERYPAGCAVADLKCRGQIQSGFGGASWLVAKEDTKAEKEAKEAKNTATSTRDISVWRFVAGRTTYGMSVVPLAAQPGRQPSMRVTLTPLSIVHQFSQADCAWYLKPGALPPAQNPDDDAPVCPERPRDTDAAFQVDVKPTAANQLFDRQMALRPLEALERASRLALLISSLLIALLLAVPAIPPNRRWPLVTSAVRRTALIWPVIISVAIAAVPDILPRGISAQSAFALTIANWAFAGCILSLVPGAGRQLALMWAVLMGLAAIGSVSLATYAGDINTTRAAGNLIKHKMIFLDVLPPLALAILTARQQALRPLLASIVLDNRKRFALVRWLPPIALISLFVIWLTVGTQQGLGTLQPVEGGKFWFVIILGTVLVSLERGSQAAVLTSSRWSRAAAAAIVLLFVLAIYAVPFLRSDYSPVLIISATGLVVVLVRFVPDVWRWIVVRFRILSERLHLPMRMRPAVYEPLFPPLLRPRVPRGTKFFASIGISMAGLVSGVLAIVLFGGVIFSIALNLERWEWPAERAERMTLLEQSLGIGRRVPIERVLTWIDLAYTGTGPSQSAPRAAFRDIGFQVIRSRVEISDADCQMSNEMRGGPPDGTGLRTLASRAVEQIAKTSAWFFDINLAPDSALCTSQPSPDRTDAATAATILDARGPETIPAAENDFAAAYLIARHGIASAALLFGFQFAFFILAVVNYAWLVGVEGGDTSDRIVRYLLSILLFGTATLFVIQWILAWSNSLGLLPVMGQPMTWLSSGTSHHLLMALPCAITILLAVRFTVAVPARPSLRAPPL
jgi:cell division protein FtsW (lipid II flippase)